MPKIKIICMLWLFIAIATFFSCGDIVGPSLNGLNYYINEDHIFFGKFTGSQGYAIDQYIQECNIGDTIVLGCTILFLSHRDIDKLIPETIRVGINTLHGSTSSVTLIKRSASALQGWNVSYSTYLVPTKNPNEWKYPAGMVTLQRYNHWIKDMETLKTPYGTFPVSADGDILTAQVTYKNKTIKKCLTIIGETK